MIAMEWENTAYTWALRLLWGTPAPLIVALAMKHDWLAATMLLLIACHFVTYFVGGLQTVYWVVSNTTQILEDMGNVPISYLLVACCSSVWFLILEHVSNQFHDYRAMFIHIMTASTVIVLIYKLRKYRLASTDIKEDHACRVAFALWYAFFCWFMYSALGAQLSDEEWFLRRMPCTKVSHLEIKCRRVSMTYWSEYYLRTAFSNCHGPQSSNSPRYREYGDFEHTGLRIPHYGVSLCATTVRNLNNVWYCYWSGICLMLAWFVSMGNLKNFMSSVSIRLLGVTLQFSGNRRRNNDAEHPSDSNADQEDIGIIRLRLLLLFIMDLIYYAMVPTWPRSVIMVVRIICLYQNQARSGLLVWFSLGTFVFLPFVFSCDYELFNVMALTVGILALIDSGD